MVDPELDDITIREQRAEIERLRAALNKISKKQRRSGSAFVSSARVLEECQAIANEAVNK